MQRARDKLMRTPSEEFVFWLCRKTFLSLWSYPNPRRCSDSPKELCDVLIVFGSNLLIFSVKEILYKLDDYDSVESKRWERRAIKESIDQIYGAERQLKRLKQVTLSDGSEGPALDSNHQSKYYRIAVALGSKDKVAIKFGDFDSGFVHVFDETSLKLIMGELDTVTDFIRYIEGKEAFCSNTHQSTAIIGGEANLLAYYLQNRCTFPKDSSFFLFEDGIWESYSNEQAYRNKKRADKISYVWDSLIESICHDHIPRLLSIGEDSSNIEKAVRFMASEDRLSRRGLSKALKDFLNDPAMKARLTRSESGTKLPYVFVKHRSGSSFEDMQAELGLRCFIARGEFLDTCSVVGLAFENKGLEENPTFIAMLLSVEEWNWDLETKRQDMMKGLGFFDTPRELWHKEDEYPSEPDT